jgi:hypothetical protein
MGHLFLVDNLIDNADLSLLVGTELPQYPIVNIQNDFTTKVCKIEANSVELLIDTKVVTAKDNIMLVGHSVDGLGFSLVSLYHSNTTDFTGSSEIVIDISTEHNLAFKSFPTTNNRYFKLVFTGTGSSTNISNIFLGAATTLESQGLSAESFNFKFSDNSDISSNKYGNRFSNRNSILKSIGGTFKVIEEDDRITLSQIINEKGLTKPFFVHIDPQGFLGDSYRFAGYYYFQGLPSFSSLSVKYFTASIELVQAG